MDTNAVLQEKVIIEGRKRITLSGVQSVDGFTDRSLNLTLLGGTAKISGSGIKIAAFNKQSGNLIADGNFTEIRYGGKKEPLLKRVLK